MRGILQEMRESGRRKSGIEPHGYIRVDEHLHLMSAEGVIDLGAGGCHDLGWVGRRESVATAPASIRAISSRF